MGLETGPQRKKKKPTITVIRALRLANGYTLEDIENKGFSKWTYSHVEGGVQKASRKMMVSIADVFSVRAKFIFDKYGYAVKFSPKDILVLAISKKKGKLV
jgi:transcriptional regulator with XRE-family HTH domain